MVTATLEDQTPTTIINFEGFDVINRRIEAENFNPIAYPSNEGQEQIHVLQWFRVFRCEFRILNDSGWPGSGDSAADKRADLEQLILTGGDSEGLLTITFDSEDSTPGSPQTESYDVRVKLLQIRSIAGENTVEISGDLELWEER